VAVVVPSAVLVSVLLVVAVEVFWGARPAGMGYMWLIWAQLLATLIGVVLALAPAAVVEAAVAAKMVTLQ
jgi:hypothetical protein